MSDIEPVMLDHYCNLQFMFAVCKGLIFYFLRMTLIYEFHMHMKYLQLQVDWILDFVVAMMDNLIGASI